MIMPGCSESPKESDNSDKESDKKVFILYRQRWWTLISYSILSLSSSWLWMTWASLATSLAQLWDVPLSAVNALAGVYSYVYIPGSFISSYLVVNQLGLRRGLIVGGILNATGACIRYAHYDNYRMVYVGTFVCALAQTFTLSTPALLAGRWFGERERATATALGILANQLGTAFGLGATIVVDFFDFDGLSESGHSNSDTTASFGNGDIIDESALEDYLLYQFIVTCIALASVVIFVGDNPPTPPSLAAAAFSHRVVTNPVDVESENCEMGKLQCASSLASTTASLGSSSSNCDNSRGNEECEAGSRVSTPRNLAVAAVSVFKGSNEDTNIRFDKVCETHHTNNSAEICRTPTAIPCFIFNERVPRLSDTREEGVTVSDQSNSVSGDDVSGDVLCVTDDLHSNAEGASLTSLGTHALSHPSAPNRGHVTPHDEECATDYDSITGWVTTPSSPATPTDCNENSCNPTLNTHVDLESGKNHTRGNSQRTATLILAPPTLVIHDTSSQPEHGANASKESETEASCDECLSSTRIESNQRQIASTMNDSVSVSTLEQDQTRNLISAPTYVESIYIVVRNMTSLAFVLCFGLAVGAYYTVPTFLAQLFPWQSPRMVGYLGVLYQVLGVVGSFFAGRAMDVMQGHRKIMLFCLIGPACCFLLCYFQIRMSASTDGDEPSRWLWIGEATSIGLAGVFLSSFNTVGIELGTGMVFPADESAVAGLMQVAASSGAFLLLTTGGLFGSSVSVPLNDVVSTVGDDEILVDGNYTLTAADDMSISSTEVSIGQENLLLLLAGSLFAGWVVMMSICTEMARPLGKQILQP